MECFATFFQSGDMQKFNAMYFHDVFLHWTCWACFHETVTLFNAS